MELSLNDLQRETLRMDISDNSYFEVRGIPASVEEEIYTKYSQLNVLENITPKEINKRREIIWQVVSFHRNKNEGVTKQTIDDLSITSVNYILLAIVKLIVNRIEIMGKVFADDTKKKEKS